MSLVFFSLVILTLGLGSSPGARAAAEVTGRTATGNSSQASLPHCVNDAATLDVIDQARTAAVKQAELDRKLQAATGAKPAKVLKPNLKYKEIEKALSTDQDVELIARLIYAETLASNCPEHRDTVSAAIAMVVKNRVEKRNGDVKSVVFQIDQFSSSLNGYDESKWRDFLCPSDAKLWAKAMKEAAVPSVRGEDVYNYYLFKHSTRFKPYAWALSDKPAQFQGSDKIADCLRAFALTPVYK